MNERPEPADTLHLRDLLDAAVRSLALSPGALHERALIASTAISGAIAAEDLPDPEDRKLLAQIQLALIELDLLDRPMVAETARLGLSDETLTRLAAHVIDLRDAVTGRALREAAESPRRP